MASLTELLAIVRPLMSAGDLTQIFDLSSSQASLASLTSSHDGVGHIRRSEDGNVEQVSYFPTFPADIKVEGLHIGMSRDAMLAAYPGLEIQSVTSEAKIKFGIQGFEGGRTLTGLEIKARVRDDKVLAFDLSRPGLTADDAKLAFEMAEEHTARRLKEVRAELWRTITDTDDMLRDWAAHCWPWVEEPTRYVAYANWLISKATPDEWHDAARQWNWDYGEAPLLWIIRQKSCDKVTALAIFAAGGPEFYSEYGWDRSAVPEFALEGFDLLQEIRRKFEEGYFQRSEIVFDGLEWNGQPFQDLCTFSDVKLYIPLSMRVSLKGRNVPLREFEDGIPVSVVNEFNVSNRLNRT